MTVLQICMFLLIEEKHTEHGKASDITCPAVVHVVIAPWIKQLPSK